MATGKFYLPSQESSDNWDKPADWPDISSVSNNEINLLVGEGGFAFNITVLSGGTFSVDYGDGIIETGKTSAVTIQHQYTTSSTGGTLTSQGFYVYKVRIYNATYAITKFYVDRHTYTSRVQYQPYLWVVLGTTGITDCTNMFQQSTIYCTLLQSVTIPSFLNNISCANMFQNCGSLQYVSLPSSWGNVGSVSQMFRSCSALKTVILPKSWNKVTSMVSMFASCTSLSNIILPSTWGTGNTSCTSMFSSCASLENIILPSTWTSSMTTAGYMFQNCYSLNYITISTGSTMISVPHMFDNCYNLKTITNINTLGSTTTASDFGAIIVNCENVQQNIICSAKLSAIGVYGASGYTNKLTSLRLTNTGSTFGGTSPQVDVSWTSLDSTALDLLFGDLPSLSSKGINITGASGAATCTKSIAQVKGWIVTG